MKLHTRLAASIFLTLVSLLTIVLLLPDSGVTVGLHRIALSTSIDTYAGGLWKWVKGKGGYEGREVRVVVFGDSWADGRMEEGGLGRGRSWGWVLCQEVNCSAHVSFAASQPSVAYLDSTPIGAVTTKRLFTSSPSQVESRLPDMVTQVRDFVTAKSEPISGHVIYALSFGFWDVYHMAGLEYKLAKRLTDEAVDELVAQVDILYTHFTKDFYKHPDNINDTSSRPPPFQIIILKLFDPSLVPGWMNRRAVPASPSTIAEQQKQAVYLTARWNSRMENALGAWVTAEADPAPEESETNENDAKPRPILPRKDVFYYDLPHYVLSLIVEHQLEVGGQKDAWGLGTGESPFTSVSEPCLRESSPDKKQGGGARNTVCDDPETYLFWDEFNLGEVANSGIGRAVAFMVKLGVRMEQKG